MTGDFAPFSSAAAFATAPASGALATGGMNRATSTGGNGSASFASCISASKFTYTGPCGTVCAIHMARISASRAAAGEAGWSSHLV
jgi:hypothetical protein